MTVFEAVNKFSNSELRILFYLWMKGNEIETTNQELGYELKVDTSAIGKTIRTLEHKGILEYTRTKSGGKSRIKSNLQLTTENGYVH